MADFSDYEWLVGDQAAMYLLWMASDKRSALKKIEALRRELTAERARLVVEQVELRRRAEAKFAELASQFYFTPTLLEQATDICLSGYKAGRFMRLGEGQLVHDFCCGIGGDAAMLTARGPTVAWDQSEVACLLAEVNLDVIGSAFEVIQADVAQIEPGAGEAWHVDPDRRASGERSTRVEFHSPGPEAIDRWLRRSADGALKLAPATETPSYWAAAGELEWISTGRECRQQVAWFGGLTTSPGLRRATRLVAHGMSGVMAGTIVGAAEAPCDAAMSPGRYLYDPDPSVLAAGLLGEAATQWRLSTLGAGGAYLTGDALVEQPLLQAFEVHDCLPLRKATVAEHLAQKGVGRVEIKKRGVETDPAKFRKGLKLRGDDEATVVLTRIGVKEVALVCRRLPDAAGVNEAAGLG